MGGASVVVVLVDVEVGGTSVVDVVESGPSIVGTSDVVLEAAEVLGDAVCVSAPLVHETARVAITSGTAIQLDRACDIVQVSATPLAG